MGGKKQRRKRSAAEKLRIVLAGQDGGVNLSELCRREGIAPSQYHQWKKQLQAGASAAFEKKASQAEEQAAAEIQRLRNVIAEITAENLELKKGALGLEDQAQVPPELRRRVREEVAQAKTRSGWPAAKTLAALGVARRSYYRWLQEEPADGASAAPPPKPIPPYAATAAEREAVTAYALKHPEVRHRELAWRMVDEEVACVSPSTVYRILQEANLVCPWRRRQKRSREECEKARRPDERWGTDLMHLQVGGRTYYYIAFLDEWSRCLVHHELLRSMDGASVSLAAQRASERWRRQAGPAAAAPEIRSDNGSGYVSREFRETLAGAGLRHQKIKPHCPEENGLVERSNRTIREAWEAAGEADDFHEAEAVLAKLVQWYNEERLHRALGYLRPIDFYRGKPEELQRERKRKLAEARQRRKEANLKLRQPMLPLGT